MRREESRKDKNQASQSEKALTLGSVRFLMPIMILLVMNVLFGWTLKVSHFMFGLEKRLPRLFCDASWQCDKDDTKSQTGYVFVVNGGKKQTTIAMSATQAEYMAASEAAMEAVWIRKFVGDLGVMPSIKKAY
ncbi:retrotransposon protein, putative, ty1-copia subclass [Tanacetum coccineum]